MKLDEMDKIVIISLVVGLLFLAIVLIDPMLISEVLENKEYLYASESVGVSMLPTFQTGDVLLILEKESPNFNPVVGDVLVYNYVLYGEVVPVAHRIYGVYDGYYAVKGDNNYGVERVYFEDVIGIVFGVAPRNPIGKSLYMSLLT